MTKVTLILGSPRKGGNTETLAEAFLSSSEKTERVDRFRLQEMDFSGCTDCRQCWSQGGPCVIEDGLKPLYASLKDSDAILFASPLYWYSWSGPVKTLWDRFLPFAYGDKPGAFTLEGKKAILVSAAGDAEGSCFQGLLFSFRRSCSLLKMTIAGEFCFTGLHGRDEASKRSELLQKLRLAGQSVL
jgi:multimeric flavodoxin WrbA